MTSMPAMRFIDIIHVYMQAQCICWGHLLDNSETRTSTLLFDLIRSEEELTQFCDKSGCDRSRPRERTNTQQESQLALVLIVTMYCVCTECKYRLRKYMYCVCTECKYRLRKYDVYKSHNFTLHLLIPSKLKELKQTRGCQSQLCKHQTAMHHGEMMYFSELSLYYSPVQIGCATGAY